MVWTCHEERPRVCRKRDDRNGVTIVAPGPGRRWHVKKKIFFEKNASLTDGSLFIVLYSLLSQFEEKIFFL